MFTRESKAEILDRHLPPQPCRVHSDTQMPQMCLHICGIEMSRVTFELSVGKSDGT